MKAELDSTEPGLGPEVEDAMRALSRVSSDLLTSYQTLAERAEHVEGELSRTNAELERMLESLPTGVVVRDATGRVVRTNGAARTILGIDEEELRGACEHPVLQRVEAAWSEREWTRPDGTHLVLATVCSEIRADNGADSEPAGDPVGTVQLIEDRTELARLTQRLHGLDKLASLGNMAGGIAHELRNPMNAIKGFAALMIPRLQEGSKEREWAHLIVEGVCEADAILSSMLTLAAPESLARETVDPEALVEEAIDIAGRDASQKVEAPESEDRWLIVSSADMPDFEGDRIKLRQALRNLISNAMQAQPEGGEVHVSLELEADEVVARVSDAGPGISPELAGRVFDPFFTTRAQGTGLGLALVGNIAQLHGGRVDVSRAPAPLGGAEVTLRIPFRPVA